MKKILLLNLGWLIACEHKTSDSAGPTNIIPEEVVFKASDGLRVAAHLYHNDENAPIIILCHQAGANKVEYYEIAKTLHNRGFNCLSIDQRGGGHLLDFENKTLSNAAESGYDNGFLEAEKDIIGAIGYASVKYDTPIILWGSSYSSSLALGIANKSDRVKAVLAFSPAQYQEIEGYSLLDSIHGLNKPCFITSSRDEANPALDSIVVSVDKAKTIHFVPQGAGNHGSASLWRTRPDHKEYWIAVERFLSQL